MTTELDEYYIRSNVEWIHLPSDVKQKFGWNTEKEYEKSILTFSIKHQLRYKGNLVRKVQKDSRKYYDDLLRYSREHLMLFPYHLSDIYVKGLRVTSFSYYIDMISDLLLQEKSYDTLPNFTAADCLRLLGIGRNQYIELINQSRTIVQSTKKKMFLNLTGWKSSASIRHLLPSQPVDSLHIQPWWMINLGCVTDDDVKQCTNEEKLIIDYLIDEKCSKLAGELNYTAIHSLYRKGLIYLDIPVNDNDYIQVPPLGSGFVMNRIVGDYFEVLLYKLFVSTDEHTNVGELSRILTLDIDLVKQTMSMFLRLGFARKKNVENDHGIIHTSWKHFSATSNLQSPPPPKELTLATTPTTSVDKSLLEWKTELEMDTSFSGDDTSLFSAADDQKSLSSPTTGNLLENSSNAIGVSNSKQKRIGFLFDSSLTAFLMMGNLSPNLKTHAVTMFEVGKLADEILVSFLQELEKISPTVLKSSEEENQSEGEADRYFLHARVLFQTISFLRLNPELFDDDPVGLGVDLLRYESLSSLDSNTRQRVIERNYQILISMAPVSAETIYSPFVSIDFLGPCLQEMNSIWMKFYLYEQTKCGPPSLLLPKGYRLNLLPNCLKSFEKFLVTTWNHEPTLISNVNILLSINEALLHSAVLIQGFTRTGENSFKEDHQQLRHVPFPFEEIEKNSLFDSLRSLIDLTITSGYITMLTLSSNPVEQTLLDVRFGIPLFDEKISEIIRNNIVKHKLCAKEKVQQRLNSLQTLSTNLIAFIERIQQSDSPMCNMPIRHSSNGIRSTCLPQRPLLFDGQTLTNFGSSLT